MSSYFTNVLMSSATYLIFGAFIFIVSFFVPKQSRPTEQGPDHPAPTPLYPRRMVRRSSIIIILFGLLMGFTSPTNTPKNTLGTNKAKENREATEIILKEEAAPIKNIATQPKQTDDERAKSFEETVDRSKFTGGGK